jgi:hypothetical protein
MMHVWTQWQCEVMTLLQGDFEEELRHFCIDPVDCTMPQAIVKSETLRSGVRAAGSADRA